MTSGTSSAEDRDPEDRKSDSVSEPEVKLLWVERAAASSSRKDDDDDDDVADDTQDEVLASPFTHNHNGGGRGKGGGEGRGGTTINTKRHHLSLSPTKTQAEKIHHTIGQKTTTIHREPLCCVCVCVCCVCVEEMLQTCIRRALMMMVASVVMVLVVVAHVAQDECMPLRGRTLILPLLHCGVDFRGRGG
jgi:hypothetical protein